MLERTTKAESSMSWLDHWDAWLSQHAVLIGGLVLALGLLLRLEAAAGTFLNPDEAEHYLVADQPSLKLAYRASVSHPHPPLFILLLYYWRHLGSSEMMLRIPSIIAGTVFCWLLFKWLSNTFNRTVALVALILAALMIAESHGLLPSTPGTTRQFYYPEFCGGWAYYVDIMCWI